MVDKSKIERVPNFPTPKVEANVKQETPVLSRVEVFFAKLFSSVILKNKIVSTVLYTISKQVQQFSQQINKRTNIDI